jgi:uncharacterized protein (DUF2236 family)
VSLDGYFDDRSVIRRVHRERVMALAAGRSLLLMAAHPVAFEGFFAQTISLQEPYERLQRTSQLLSLITYGPREPARAGTARVRALHRRVRGTLPEAAGRFPAGTPYAADDPELLLWILASLFDSNLLVHDRYIGSLVGEERRQLWREYRVIGRLFGLRAGEMPRELEDLREYMSVMLDGDDLHVTGRARELGARIVLHPPIPLLGRPLLELANFVTVGLLPPRLREEYRLSWDPARSIALFGGAQYARRVLLPLLPGRLRYSRPGIAA